MTVLDDRQLICDLDLDRAWQDARLVSRQPVRRPVRRVPAERPAPTRPAMAAVHYRGTGVGVSQAPHTRRPVSTSVAFGLAVVAALITLWLGTLAQFSGERTVSANIPERLAVVHVQAGETLQQLARRIAPDAPTAMVVDRIRDLNKLDSASVDVGQTLIAPLG